MASERERPHVQRAREQYLERLPSLDPKKLIFIDEAGAHRSMTSEYGWAPVGQRLHISVPRNRGRITTMLGALGWRGLRALMTVEGGTTKDVFLRFVSDHLVPVLRPGDVVVLDNLGAHHATGVRQAIEAAGATVLYLPPYSPELNPIELCWSKLKRLLKRRGVRARAMLEQFIHWLAEFITASDAQSWFKHCGYTQRE